MEGKSFRALESSLAAIPSILAALARAERRNVATFESIKVNNFFLFVCLLMYGALHSGVRPSSSEPFLMLIGFLLLFPLSADPLAKVPPVRLALWPLRRAERLGLRLTSWALSPVLWIAAVILLATTRPAPAAFFLAVAIVIQSMAVLNAKVTQKVLSWNLRLYVPPVPGRLGGMIRNNVRQLLSVLDPYVALLIAAGGSAGRVLSRNPDPSAFPILSILAALALSTYTQCLFALDSAAGIARYRLLPLPGWQILLAKDVAWLAVLFLLVLPLDPTTGLAFGLTALAIGHYASVHLYLPQQRWRFTGGRLLPFGLVQMIASTTVGFAAHQRGLPFLTLAAALWLVSLFTAGSYWDRNAQPAARSSA